MPWCTCEGQRTIAWSVLSFQGSNLGFQIWQQGAFPAAPSCRPQPAFSRPWFTWPHIEQTHSVWLLRLRTTTLRLVHTVSPMNLCIAEFWSTVCLLMIFSLEFFEAHKTRESRTFPSAQETQGLTVTLPLLALEIVKLLAFVCHVTHLGDSKVTLFWLFADKKCL